MNPKIQITLDVELEPGGNAVEYSQTLCEGLTLAINRGLLTEHDPSITIEQHSVRSAVLHEGDPLEVPSAERIPEGTGVAIKPYTKSGLYMDELESYPAQEGVLAEDCVPASGGIVELENGNFVYSDSVSRLP